MGGGARVRSTVGRAVYGLLRLLDRVLQLVIPPRRGQVSFLSIPDHTDNAYYTYQHLVRTRRDLTLVWLVGDPGFADRIRRDFASLTASRPDHGHTLLIEPRRSVRGYLAYLRSRHVFHSQGAYAFSRWAFRRHVVNLWHGMPIKAIGLLNHATPSAKRAFGTVHVATSHAFRYIIAAAFGVAPTAVEVTGLPRCDALQFPQARATSSDEVRRRLSVPAERRLVVWMPTYRVQNSGEFVHRRLNQLVGAPRPAIARSFLDDLPPGMLEAIDAACEAHRCTVLIKLHPLDALNATGAPSDLRHVRCLTSPAFLDSEIQLYDLLAASDGLLSDISSVIIDYLVASRPIGLIGFDEEHYDRELLLPVDLFLASPRFHALDDRHDVEAFFARVATGEPVADGDLHRMLHEPITGGAAEAIASRVGL